MTTTAPLPTAKPSDFADMVNLLERLSTLAVSVSKLEAKLNSENLTTVRQYADEYKALQTELGQVESALAVIAERNPQWFSEKKTITTPFGEVKRTTSTKLEIADETATIALIRSAKREEDFLVVSTALNREALENLEDDELRKFGVRRSVTHNYNPAPASVDLGKAVKAAEKSARAAAKAAKAAR
jgi:hypothetical protein